MHLKVLGPLTADLNGISVVPTAAKQRQILALLALYPNRILPTATLIEEIWGDDPPRQALTTMQTYILQLRRRITQGLGPTPHITAKDILTTRHGGYQLTTHPDNLDVHTYSLLTTQGQHAFNHGHDHQAATHFRQALALWHGPALVDVRPGPILAIEIMRLEESRLITLERRIDTDLRLGRHNELIPELTHLTHQHPHHEGLHAQAMVALYRAGRQTTALATYHHLRHRLTTELGIQPSPHLQHVHHAILTLDPTLNTPTTAHPTTYNLYPA
ncbi:BTAD domain-containing putative transcriptional regulator [Kitasatospora sp. NPDC057940]|uniref:AfsR/SARP family transcriptional regulator n=1 Tax=unclassified Kitasatospora TaxID=2633591 RepID=UPI00352FC349|nr:AfsR/SARP family transcriptional regulator [Kitasatospora sp. NBC_01300]